MIKIKTLRGDRINLRESCIVLAKDLGNVGHEVKRWCNYPTFRRLGKKHFIRDHGGVPGFLGLYEFSPIHYVGPNARNVVHGIPNNNPLINGDIIFY